MVVNGDVARIRIFTCKAKIDPVAGHDDLDLGFMRCRLSRFRCLLYELQTGYISTDRFVEPAVESYRH